MVQRVCGNKISLSPPTSPQRSLWNEFSCTLSESPSTWKAYRCIKSSPSYWPFECVCVCVCVVFPTVFAVWYQWLLVPAHLALYSSSASCWLCELGELLHSSGISISSSVKWRYNTGWLGGLKEDSCEVLTAVSGTHVSCRCYSLGSSYSSWHVELL